MKVAFLQPRNAISGSPAPGSARRAFEEVEVAALVGLGDVLQVQRAVAARVLRRGGCCQSARRCASSSSSTSSVEPPRRHVELDDVAGLAPAPAGRRRTTRARRAARTRRSWCRSSARRRSAPCRARPARAASSGSAAAPTRACPARPAGRRCCSTSTESGVDAQVRDRRCARPCRRSSSNTTAGPGVLVQPRLGGRRLDHRAVRAPGCRAAPPGVSVATSGSSRVRITSSLKTSAPRDVLAERRAVRRSAREVSSRSPRSRSSAGRPPA